MPLLRKLTRKHTPLLYPIPKVRSFRTQVLGVFRVALFEPLCVALAPSSPAPGALLLLFVLAAGAPALRTLAARCITLVIQTIAEFV